MLQEFISELPCFWRRNWVGGISFSGFWNCFLNLYGSMAAFLEDAIDKKSQQRQPLFGHLRIDYFRKALGWETCSAKDCSKISLVHRGSSVLDCLPLSFIEIPMLKYIKLGISVRIYYISTCSIPLTQRLTSYIQHLPNPKLPKNQPSIVLQHNLKIRLDVTRCFHFCWSAPATLDESKHGSATQLRMKIYTFVHRYLSWCLSKKLSKWVCDSTW